MISCLLTLFCIVVKSALVQSSIELSKSVPFMSVEVTISADFDITQYKSVILREAAMLIFAAESSFSKTWSSFSSTRLRSSFERRKLNKLWRPFSISVSVKKCWQAFNSSHSWSLFSSFSKILFKPATESLAFNRWSFLGRCCSE